MKLVAIVVLSGVLTLFTSAMYAAGEGPLDAANVIQTDFAASEAAFVLRSKMTGINFGMPFKGSPFVVSSTFSLRNIGMNTEGYIDTRDAGAMRMSSPDRTGTALTALLHQRMLWLFIVCLVSIAFAFVAWRLMRQSVETSSRQSGITKSEQVRGANALTERLTTDVRREYAVFPSIPAAIVTGAVVMPVFMWGLQVIERTTHSPVLVLSWAVLAFFAPVLFSTGDMRYAVKRWREVGFLRLLMSREDFQEFYIPAWIRIGVLFVSTVAAMLALKAFGLDL